MSGRRTCGKGGLLMPVCVLSACHPSFVVIQLAARERTSVWLVGIGSGSAAACEHWQWVSKEYVGRSEAPGFGWHTASVTAWAVCFCWAACFLLKELPPGGSARWHFKFVWHSSELLPIRGPPTEAALWLLLAEPVLVGECIVRSPLQY